jgi:2-keto-myo-inositol isomerase
MSWKDLLQMLPTLSQVCSLNAPFGMDLQDYAAGQCHSVEIWLTKLEEFLKTHEIADVRRLLDEQQMQAPVAGFQGGLLTSQGEARKAAWELFEQRLTLCRELGISTLVVACDIQAPLQQSDLERVRQSLLQIAQAAGRRQLCVALEFQARAAFGNNLQTAVALIEEVASPHLGICLDVFHFYLGPSQTADLKLLNARNLFHVQLADLADVPRELATDSDRILPGDGDFDLAPILDRLHQIDYQGCVAIELMNPQLWQVPPRQFGEIAMTALRKLLGQSAMQ